MRELDAMRERWGGNSARSLYLCVGAVEVWASNLQDGSDGSVIEAAAAEYRALDARRRGLPLPKQPLRRPW